MGLSCYLYNRQIMFVSGHLDMIIKRIVFKVSKFHYFLHQHNPLLPLFKTSYLRKVWEGFTISYTTQPCVTPIGNTLFQESMGRKKVVCVPRIQIKCFSVDFWQRSSESVNLNMSQITTVVPRLELKLILTSITLTG